MVIIVCFILANQIFAQDESRKNNLSIGYFGSIAYRPGVKIGSQFSLKKWETKMEGYSKLKSFYVSPQIGFYIYPNVHTGYLLNTDVGYKRVKDKTGKYSALSIGLGFLVQSHITERKINLRDGSSENTRENRTWFLSTLNYEFGKAINEKIGWYTKFSYGFKLSAVRENSSVLFLEMGMQFNLF